MKVGDILNEEEKRKIFYNNRNKFYRVLVSHSVTKETRYSLGFFISDSGILRVNLGFLTCKSDKPIQAELEIKPGRTIPLTDVIYHSYHENFILFYLDPTLLEIRKPTIAEEQPCNGDVVCLIYYHEKTGKLKYLWTNIFFYRYQTENNLTLFQVDMDIEVNYAYGYIVLNEHGQLCGSELFSKDKNLFGHASFFCNVPRSHYSIENPEKLYSMSLMNYFDSWQYAVYYALFTMTLPQKNNENCIYDLYDCIQANPTERIIHSYFILSILMVNNDLTLEIFRYWIAKLGNSSEIRRTIFNALDSIHVTNRYELKSSLLEDLLLDYPQDLELLNFQLRRVLANNSYEEASKLLTRMNHISNKSIFTLDAKMIYLQSLNQGENEFIEIEKDFLEFLDQKLTNLIEIETLTYLLIDYMYIANDFGRDFAICLEIFLKFLDQYPDAINLWKFLNSCRLTNQSKKDILAIYQINSYKIFPTSELYHLLTRITEFQEEGFSRYYYYEKSLRLYKNEKVITDLMIDLFIDSSYEKSYDLSEYLANSEEEIIRGRSYFVKACYHHVHENFEKKGEMHRYLENNYPDEAINFANFVKNYKVEIEVD